MNDKDKQLFLELYQMILSDTEVHPKELEMLYQIGRRRGATEQDIHHALLSPGKFATSQSLSDDEKIEYLYDLACMAWADGILDEREKECLQDVCKRLGFEEQYVAEITDFLLQQVRDGKQIEQVLESIKNL
jgi:uncharacterized tellurite resistance protein B-like protein